MAYTSRVSAFIPIVNLFVMVFLLHNLLYARFYVFLNGYFYGLPFVCNTILLRIKSVVWHMHENRVKKIEL